MKVLIACECSGTVREAFRSLGYDAYSCDILPSDIPSEYHYQDDVFNVIKNDWDLMIAHPPCTDLAVSGAAWFAKKRANGTQQKSIDFFMKLAEADIPYIAVENPVSIMSTEWRKPDQIIQPWMFGDSYSKKTCLWLKNLPTLEATNIVDQGEFVEFSSGRRMPKWYSDAFRLKPSERAKLRSKTFPGIAQAMAQQWGDYVCQKIT